MKKIKLIGIYQMLTTIIFLVYLFIRLTSEFSIWSIPIYLILIIMMGFIFYAGYKMFDNPLKGIKLSIFAQIIQSMGFSVPGFLYLFTSSRYFSFIWNESFLGLNFYGEIVGINIRIDQSIESFGIQIFIIPIIFIIILFIEGFKLEKQENKEIEEKNNYAQHVV